MDQLEREKIINSAKKLREREINPDPLEDPFSDMTSEEKSKLLIEFKSMHESDRKVHESDRKQINNLMERLDKLIECQTSSPDYKALFEAAQKQIAELLKRISSLEELLKVKNTHIFGSKSQKGKTKKNDDTDDHQKNKDDFDGTSESIHHDSSSESENNSQSQGKQESRADKIEKESRLYRKGMEYRTMTADKSVCHHCDKSRLPEGAEVIKVLHKYSYEQVSEIVEHEYEVLRYKMKDGKICDGYFPCDGEPEIIDIVPGTHASSSFMAYLAFNKYVLDTPIYRENSRIKEESMLISRMTLTNWLEKGSRFINEMIKMLKESCLEKDSFVNCDETWCKVKVMDTYRKRYIWCLVNRVAKVVIYCYEDGSRGRDALRHILGESKIRALQSDGYNVYMYLDNELTDIDHLCCLAHARAKFKYALEQGGDKDAEYFLDCIGELYQLESQYEKGKLSEEQIKVCRQSLKTKEIMIKLRSKLDSMLTDDHPPRGELMEKALRYLKTFWSQLFLFTKDGSYTIDNSLAERFIRPLACERKNSLFFGSDKMARVSAAYHTIISTCKMQNVSILEYLRIFFREIVNGRKDYYNLLPMTIGISNNKL